MAPEPTTDIKAKKPLPKWAYFAIGGGAIVLVYLYKKKKEKEEEEKPVGQGAYTAQSFIPVTGENVAGVGAQGGTVGASGVPQSSETNTALLDAEQKNLETITNYLISSQENREKKELIPQPINVNITGGGAPSSGQIGTGSGAASPPSGGSPGSKPVSPPAVNKCPSTFKEYNPANGPPGPHSCYHISREKAKRPGYVIHGYQDGHEVESR